jgi:peptide-methionine (S)-S-oxide reductase
MGCFWGPERLLEAHRVYSTAAGYAGGHVSTLAMKMSAVGGRGQTEVVLVVFDPAEISRNTYSR